jgi:hypothetical protein
LTTSPPTTLKKSLEGCSGIVDNIRMANVILICPVPRYVLEKCCNDPSHIENHSNVDFDEEISEYQEQHRRVLVGWATSKGLDFTVMDPTAIVNPTEPLLRNRTTSGGTSIWCTGDPVHLSQDAYRDLAMAVQEAHDGADAEGDSASLAGGTGRRFQCSGSGSGSHGSSFASEKRRIPDAVVTLPTPVTPKRGRYTRPPVAAGWLRGVSSRGHGASANSYSRGMGVGRGRSGGAHGHRGQIGHWPKRGRSSYGRRW